MPKVKVIPSPTATMPQMPLPFSFVREYILLQRELEQVKQRLLELEAKEKVIVLKEITEEEAREEIRQLFAGGRTLYYSDIVKELKLDLKTVVELCNELQERGEIKVDADIS